MSEKGVAMDPAKVDKIKSWPTPMTFCEVQQFLGLANYYRQFIQGFADIAKPLHKLTEHNTSFKWTPDCNKPFVTLCSKLKTTPILAYPDFTRKFILNIDASNSAIGAVLFQLGPDGQEHVIAYGNRLLTKSKRQYVTESRKTVPNHTFLFHYIYYCNMNGITFSTLLHIITWNLMLKLSKLCNKYSGNTYA